MLLKYILYFIPFFALLYSENFDIMGMPFSQLWKIPLIIFLIIHFIKYIKSKKPAFQQISIWYAVKMLFNTNITYRPITNITEFARFLPFPLLFEYFKRKKFQQYNQMAYFIKPIRNSFFNTISFRIIRVNR